MHTLQKDLKLLCPKQTKRLNNSATLEDLGAADGRKAKIAITNNPRPCFLTSYLS